MNTHRIRPSLSSTVMDSSERTLSCSNEYGCSGSLMSLTKFINSSQRSQICQIINIQVPSYRTDPNRSHWLRARAPKEPRKYQTLRNRKKDIIDFERINGVISVRIFGASDSFLLSVNHRVRVDQTQSHLLSPSSLRVSLSSLSSSSRTVRLLRVSCG